MEDTIGELEGDIEDLQNQIKDKDFEIKEKNEKIKELEDELYEKNEDLKTKEDELETTVDLMDNIKSYGLEYIGDLEKAIKSDTNKDNTLKSAIIQTLSGNGEAKYFDEIDYIKDQFIGLTN